MLRFSVVFVFYFFISWFFALLGLFFKADFNRHFGHWGFILYWLVCFFGMAALGFALEAWITILTPRFLGPFMVLWLITNLASAVIPTELQPSIYRYGKTTPFYNMNRAVRTILFGTRNQLALNFGVLFVWIVVSMMVVALAQTWRRRGQEKEQAAKQRAEEEAWAPIQFEQEESPATV